MTENKQIIPLIAEEAVIEQQEQRIVRTGITQRDFINSHNFVFSAVLDSQSYEASGGPQRHLSIKEIKSEKGFNSSIIENKRWMRLLGKFGFIESWWDNKKIYFGFDKFNERAETEVEKFYREKTYKPFHHYSIATVKHTLWFLEKDMEFHIWEGGEVFNQDGKRIN